MPSGVACPTRRKKPRSRALASSTATSATSVKHTTASHMRPVCSSPSLSRPGAPKYAAETLWERLPETLKAAEQRERELYGETDINEIGHVLKSYVDFVELCARKEDETGKPCLIIASY